MFMYIYKLGKSVVLTHNKSATISMKALSGKILFLSLVIQHTLSCIQIHELGRLLALGFFSRCQGRERERDW